MRSTPGARPVHPSSGVAHMLMTVLLAVMCVAPPRHCGGSAPTPALLLQLSDIHVSAIEDPGRVTDLLRLAEEVLPGLAPHAVFVSGDLVHSKVFPGNAPIGRQVESEFQVRNVTHERAPPPRPPTSRASTPLSLCLPSVCRPDSLRPFSPPQSTRTRPNSIANSLCWSPALSSRRRWPFRYPLRRQPSHSSRPLLKLPMEPPRRRCLPHLRADGIALYVNHASSIRPSYPAGLPSCALARPAPSPPPRYAYLPMRSLRH